MKRFLKLMMMAIVFTLPTMFVACDDDDEKENNGGNDSPEEFVTVKRIKQMRGFDVEEDETDEQNLNYDEKGRIRSLSQDDQDIMTISYEYPDSIIIEIPQRAFHCHIDENNRIDVYYDYDLDDETIDTIELAYNEAGYLIGENNGEDFAEYEGGNLLKCGFNDIEYSKSYFSTMTYTEYKNNFLGIDINFLMASTEWLVCMGMDGGYLLPALGFMGKLSENLMATEKDNGSSNVYNYLYEFNTDGDVVKVTVKKNEEIIYIYEFTYETVQIKK